MTMKNSEELFMRYPKRCKYALVQNNQVMKMSVIAISDGNIFFILSIRF